MSLGDFVIRDGVLVKYIGTDSIVRIPEGVRKIGDGVFEGAKISEVYLPNGLCKIGTRAFACCNMLKKLELPFTLSEIGRSAFEDCAELTGADGKNSALRMIDSRAFAGCTRLASLSLPDSVTDIGAFAFYQCGALCDLTLPRGLCRIGTRAFAFCDSLKTVSVPGGVAEISSGAFFRCKGINALELCEGIKTLGDAAFLGCTGLSDVTIPSTVTSIGTGAFNCCSGITSINIPNGIKVISPHAFAACSLEHIEIPESVCEICEGAFEYCVCLNNVVLPSGLRIIGKRAFASCGSVDVSRIGESTESIGASAFAECDVGQSFTVPDRMTSLGTIFGEYPPTFIYSLSLGIESITPKYRREAFFGLCSAIEKGAAPSEETLKGYIAYSRRIKKRIYNAAVEMPFVIAFLVKHKVLPFEDIDYLLERCGHLTETSALLLGYKAELGSGKDSDELFDLELSEPKEPTVTELKREYSFAIKEDGTVAITSYKGSALRVVVPPFIGKRRVSSIARFAFSPRRTRSVDSARATARLIEEVELCEGIEEIGESAFMSCESLKRINIPMSVRKIANHAFCECESLSEIDFGDVSLPRESTEIGTSAFLGCDSLIDITLPVGCRLRGDGVFWSCSALETAVLPESVDHIFDYTFGNCPSLCEITINSISATAATDAFFSLASTVKVKAYRNSQVAEKLKADFPDIVIEYLDKDDDSGSVPNI